MRTWEWCEIKKRISDEGIFIVLPQKFHEARFFPELLLLLLLLLNDAVGKGSAASDVR